MRRYLMGKDINGKDWGRELPKEMTDDIMQE